MKAKTVLMIVFVCACAMVRSQETEQLLNNLVSEDSTAITALSQYPEKVRKNILEACAYPEALVRMDALQKNTRASFTGIVGTYSKEEQQEIWDLTRYPGLIDKLAQGEKKREVVKKIASEYPEDIRETAIKYGIHHHELLQKISALNVNSDKAFESVIKEYPDKAKIALRELVKNPEVVDILTSEMKMSVLVGDLYKRQPELVLKKLDSISAEHEVQKARDREDWLKGLEENPEAKKEFEGAAKEFVKEHGYEEDELYVTNETVVVEYVVNPYPYWYGYPHWYGYPYWYPYPYWYDLGFYWGWRGGFYFGFPSPYFSYWFFGYPYNYFHYPYYADYCVDYYYGHHRSATGFNHEVSNWVKTTEQDVPANFFADKGRPARIQELGKFELDYSKAAKSNPQMNISKREFLQANASSYPSVSPVLSEPRPLSGRPDQGRTMEAPVKGAQQQQHPTLGYPRDPGPVHPRSQPRSQPMPQSRPAPQNIPQSRPMPQSRPQSMPQSRPMPQSPPQSRPQSMPQSRPMPPQSAPRPRGPSASEDKKRIDDFARMPEAGEYHRMIWNAKQR